MGSTLFWLAMSLLLVGFSLMVLLMIAIPTLKEIARAAKSFDRLCRTLEEDFPPTLDAIRSTGTEINGLSNDLQEGLSSTRAIVKQLDTTVQTTAQKAKRLGLIGRTLRAGLKAGWSTFTKTPKSNRKRLKGSSVASKRRRL